MLGLIKFGTCSTISVGRLTLVEGGLVWRLVAVLFFCIFFRLMRMYTPKDNGTTVRIANIITRPESKPENTKTVFPIKKTTKRNNM